jgi:hypothetical protein
MTRVGSQRLPPPQKKNIYILECYVSALGKDILPALQTALEMEALKGIPQHLWNLICSVSVTKTFSEEYVVDEMIAVL